MDWSGGSQCVVPRPAIWGWGPGCSDAHSCLRTTGVENKYLWANSWLRAGHGHWAWAAEQKQPYSWSQIKLRFRRQGFLRGSAGEGKSVHCRTLAWEVPWTEEPGGLQSMGLLRSPTRLSDFTFTFHFHALEEEMTTHSSVLAWRIPGMGEPGGLRSMGSHKVGHDWSDLAAAAAAAATAEAQLVKNPPVMWETWVWSLGWEDPLEKETDTHSSILAWRIPWTV